jgi:hypothetical protein
MRRNLLTLGRRVLNRCDGYLGHPFANQIELLLIPTFRSFGREG